MFCRTNGGRGRAAVDAAAAVFAVDCIGPAVVCRMIVEPPPPFLAVGAAVAEELPDVFERFVWACRKSGAVFWRTMLLFGGAVVLGLAGLVADADAWAVVR